MEAWYPLLALFVACIASIYLIAKGVEMLLRCMDRTSSTRATDLLFGAILLIPGSALGILVYFWMFPWIQQRP